MIYKEEHRDLFSVSNDYYLAHCISADFAMGKGIAVEFNKRFNMKNVLTNKYPDYFSFFVNKFSEEYDGDCILEGRVLNLITKKRYYNKPSYKTLECALAWMKIIVRENNIKKIAMPLIGCGLDRLKWSKVSKIIKSTFKDTDIEILICKQ